MDFYGQETQTIEMPKGDFENFTGQATAAAPQRSRRAVRWVVMAGNVLPPHATRNNPMIPLGGENIGGMCMTLMGAKNGYLQRCQLTPMVTAKDWINADEVGEQNRHMFESETVSVYNKVTKQVETTQRYFVRCLPADELSSLLSGQQGADGRFDMGIREVEALYDERAVEPKTEDFNRAIARGTKYQRIIFPDWDKYISGEKEFFNTPALEKYLLNRKTELAGDQTAVDIIDVLIQSNRQFIRYVRANLKNTADKLDILKKDGSPASWSAVHDYWFTLLNLTREEFLEEKTEQHESNAVTKEEFSEYKNNINELVGVVRVLANKEVERQTPKEEVETKSCAGLNAKNEPCKSKATIEVDEVFYCSNHQPK